MICFQLNLLLFIKNKVVFTDEMMSMLKVTQLMKAITA